MCFRKYRNLRLLIKMEKPTQKIIIICALVLIILVTAIYGIRLTGYAIENSPTPLMIYDISDKEGIYRGWPGEEVGARIIPARICYDDAGNSGEMEIKIFGGDYPYGDEPYYDYENPENNNDIQFGSIRITSDIPQTQHYFDTGETSSSKKWPVWIEFDCGSKKLDIKAGDKLYIEYNGGHRVYINLPDLTNQQQAHFFVSSIGEIYDSPVTDLSVSLAPKVCTETDGGDNIYLKGNTTGDLFHEDFCGNWKLLIEWYCDTDNMASFYIMNCEERYMTECRNGICLKCIPETRLCNQSEIIDCKDDGSGWDREPCELGCGAPYNGLYSCYEACNPYTYKGCQGDKLKVCNMNGSSWSIEDCDYEQVCRNGECVESDGSRESEDYEGENNDPESYNYSESDDELYEPPQEIEYYCEWIWPQKIINKNTEEVLWTCMLTPSYRPYCKSGTTQCCNYNFDSKTHFDCIDMS